MKLDIQLFAVTKSTSFSESNISIQDNTSSLTITIKFSPNNTSTFFSSETLYCTCNGVTKSKKISLSKGGSVNTSIRFDNIPHNNDGTKTVSWAWNCNTGTAVLGNISASGTRTLTKIARASGLSFSPDPAELGSALTISLTKYIEDSTDTLSFSIGGSSGTIGTTDQDQYIWTPPITLAEEIINSTSGVCTITCTSYDGDTLIGTSTATLTLEVPSSVVPSVSIGTLTEANATMISKNWGVFVQNKSQLNIPITATGIYDSTITSIITEINGQLFEGSNITTPTLVTSGTNTITTTITDSRGRTATATKTYSVEPYTNPTIATAQVQRCLNDGTISDDGTYLLINYVGEISAVANNNDTVFKIGYKLTSSSTYTYVTLGQNYTINLTDSVSSFTISPDYAYDIIFEATDSFSTSSIDREIDTGFDLLNFNPSGKSMAIGKVSEASSSEELLEVALETTFLKDVTTQDITTGDITATDVSANDISATDITATGDVSIGNDLTVSNDISGLSLTLNGETILVPYVLYEDSVGSAGTITLQDSAANYEYLDIYYYYIYNSNWGTKFTRIYNPNGAVAALELIVDNNSYLYIERELATISGTSITRSGNVRWRLATGGANTRTADANDVCIFRVIGYK